MRRDDRTLTIRAIAAIALCAMATGTHSQSPPNGKRGQGKPQPQQTEQQPASEKIGTDQSPLVVKIQPAPDAESKATEDAKERKEKAELDRKLVEFNGDLAYYTKILAWVAGLQFLALVIQSIVLVISLRHSSKSAEAAKSAADIAGKTLAITQRAYIAVKELRSHPFYGENGAISEWQFTIVFVNNGHTPAIGAQLYTGLLMQPAQTFKGFSVEEVGHAMDIAPAVTVDSTAILRLTMEAARQIVDGKIEVFLCGFVRYGLAFTDGTIPQKPRTSVCVRLVIDDPQFSRLPHFRYVAHPQQNETT